MECAFAHFNRRNMVHPSTDTEWPKVNEMCKTMGTACSASNDPGVRPEVAESQDCRWPTDAIEGQPRH